MNKIKYGRQDISEDDIASVVKVLRSDLLTQGPMVPAFERSVSQYCKAKFAVAVNSATSALHIAYKALDLKNDDLLWTSANTFVATANAAIMCGAKVDFLDIDPNTYNICVDKLEKKLINAKEINMLPKIVVPVFMCGQSCDMKRIKELSKEYNFKIVEDASHGIGGAYKNHKIGSANFADITVLSFHPVKIITTGEGGMALTNNKLIFEKMQRLRSHGITGDKKLFTKRNSSEIWNYQQIELGNNYRMTDIQAALGISQLKRVDEFVLKRNKIAKRYNNLLKDLNVTVPLVSDDCYSSFHLYVIRLNKKGIKTTQKNLYDKLTESGIQVNLHYIPVHRQPYYESLGFREGYCPEAEKYHKDALTIPLHPLLSDEEINFISSKLYEFL